ncbi:MAG: c-type cytochrome domain-containing protein [Limisphaerales bacterium]
MLCALPAGSMSAEDRPDIAPDFKKDVLPVFEAKCLRCHGEKKRDAKLDMRTVGALLTGGVSGPAIKPGNAEKSLLIELLRYNEMPPKKETPRVTKEELALLRKWINTMPAPSATRPVTNRPAVLPSSR